MITFILNYTSKLRVPVAINTGRLPMASKATVRVERWCQALSHPGNHGCLCGGHVRLSERVEKKGVSLDPHWSAIRLLRHVFIWSSPNLLLSWSTTALS